MPREGADGVTPLQLRFQVVARLNICTAAAVKNAVVPREISCAFGSSKYEQEFLFVRGYQSHPASSQDKVEAG